MLSRSRIASALEFRAPGEDDSFDDAFEFFILIPVFQFVPSFELEYSEIFIQPLVPDFLFEFQNPTASLPSPVGIRHYLWRLVWIIFRRLTPHSFSGRSLDRSLRLKPDITGINGHVGDVSRNAKI